MGAKGQKLLTTQKRLVSEVIEEIEGLFTAHDLCARLADRQAKVSRATAYRLLAMFCSGGKVLEFWLPGGRRVCARSGGSFHRITECETCGRLEYSATENGGSEGPLQREETILHTTIYQRVNCCPDKKNRAVSYAIEA